MSRKLKWLAALPAITMTAIWLSMGESDAKPIKPDCTLANSVAPAFDKIGANIYGLASYGKWLLVVLLVAALFASFSKHLPKLLRGVFAVLAIGFALVVIQSVWNITGAPSC